MATSRDTTDESDLEIMGGRISRRPSGS